MTRLEKILGEDIPGILVLILLFGVCLPNLIWGIRSSHEASAIQTVKMLANTENGHQKIGDNVAVDEKNGYHFRVIETDDNDPSGFIVSAIPTNASWIFCTGTKRFGATEDGEIHEDSENLNSHFSDKASLANAKKLESLNESR